MFEGIYAPPFYTDLYNFLDGPQDDIFADSYATLPPPNANQTRLPVLQNVVPGQRLPIPNASLLPSLSLPPLLPTGSAVPPASASAASSLQASASTSHSTSATSQSTSAAASASTSAQETQAKTQTVFVTVFASPVPSSAASSSASFLAATTIFLTPAPARPSASATASVSVPSNVSNSSSSNPSPAFNVSAPVLAGGLGQLLDIDDSVPGDSTANGTASGAGGDTPSRSKTWYLPFSLLRKGFLTEAFFFGHSKRDVRALEAGTVPARGRRSLAARLGLGTYERKRRMHRRGLDGLWGLW